MKNKSLPPRVGKINSGEIQWQKLDSIDFQTLGYFLSCHLIIDHYLEEYIKITAREFDWESARLTFAQKITLLSKIKLPPKYNFIGELKHLNTLRNKISHRLDFKLNDEDLLPFTIFIQKVYDGENKAPREANNILGAFIDIVCSFLAGSLTVSHLLSKKTDKEDVK